MAAAPAQVPIRVVDPLLSLDEVDDLEALKEMLPNLNPKDIERTILEYRNYGQRRQVVAMVLIEAQHHSSSDLANHRPSAPQQLNEALNRDEDKYVGDDTLQEFGIEVPLNTQQKSNLHMIMQIFADVDPKWVVDKLEDTTVDELVERMAAEPGSYDKVKSKQGTDLTARRRDDMLDRNLFDPAQFLQVYPDPLNIFMDEKGGQKSFLYVDHANIAMRNEFCNLRIDFLKKVLIKHSQRFYPSYKEVKMFLQKSQDVLSPPFVKRPRRPANWPANIDEAFFKELQYAKWEEDVLKYQADLYDARLAKLAEAKKSGTLEECGCCLLDELIPEDMIKCNNAHAFCKPCVAQNVNQRLEQGHHKIGCLSVGCAAVYQASSMRHFLQATTFNRLISLMQKDELREANVENLCSCPFCDFAMVIDNPNEKLFTCLNPKCLKVSCRECKELNHIPLRCNEVEKDEDVKMRTYIEEKCAEALIRKCPRCSRPIIKESGCNRMSCPCGTSFCYVCNKELDKGNPYGHFKDGASAGGKTTAATSESCKTMTSMAEVHEQVTFKAAEEARKKYVQENPHMQMKAPDTNKLKQMVGMPDNFAAGENIRHTGPVAMGGHFPGGVAHIGQQPPRPQRQPGVQGYPRPNPEPQMNGNHIDHHNWRNRFDAVNHRVNNIVNWFDLRRRPIGAQEANQFPHHQ